MADRQRPIATTARALVCAVYYLLCGLFGFFMLAAMMLPRALGASAKKPAMARSYFVYVGTYTRESSKGIYGYRFDPATGKLTSTGLAAYVKNPSFLASDPTHRFLYA